MKTCRRCRKSLPLHEFSKGRAHCKPCRNEIMRGYYKENRDACIARAKSWAAENPKKKREINKASNLKLHGTPSYQTITPEDHKYVWNQFLSDMGRAASQEERDVLCADLLDSSAAKVNTVPCAVEEFLVAYAEKELGH